MKSRNIELYERNYDLWQISIFKRCSSQPSSYRRYACRKYGGILTIQLQVISKFKHIRTFCECPLDYIYRGFAIIMNVNFKSKTVSTPSIDQKTRRRRNTLFRKATEYCSECFADIQMIIRLKKTGDVYILTSKSKGWPLSETQLV
jgi:hypothetical protein